MRRKFSMKKIMALLLTGCTVAGCFGACAKTETKDYGGSEKPNGKPSEIVVETDDYLVKNGGTEYKILADSDPSADEVFAESELIDVFKQATGITLSVVTDEAAELSTNCKYLSIGDNELLKQQTGVDVSYETLGEDGFKLVTKGKTIFMCGGGEQGTLYAVYEFLSRTVDFETFGPNGTRIASNIKELKLFEYDVTQIPSFRKRTLGSGVIYEAEGTQRRLRLQTTETYLGDVNKVQVHNSLAYLPPATYAEEHPDWYTNSLGELCYTAHGNENEYELMAQAAADALKAELPKTNVSMFTLTQQDNTAFCNCPSCVAEEAANGARSGAIVKFANKVHDLVMAWFETEEGKAYKRDFRLYFFAYQDSLDAPVKRDAQGNARPANDDVICHKGVGVYFAPMELDYERSIYEDVNHNFLSAFTDWKVLTDEMILWAYATNFNYYLMPYDCFEYMQEFFKVAKSAGVQTFYHQHQNNQIGGSTGWENLKLYLSAKLLWDVDADVGALTQDFFEAYYGPVADEMLQLYTEFRAHSAVVKKNTAPRRSTIYANRLKEEYWQRQMLLDWSERIAALLKKLEPLKKQDKAEYDRIYKNVAAEGVSYDYILTEVYGNTFSQSELKEVKTELRGYLTLSGISKLDLLTSINDYVESLKN